MSADLEYVFGPVIATDTLLNLNLQFHRVVNRQQSVGEDRAFSRGWAWSSDEDALSGDCTGGDYDIDSEKAVEDLLLALREVLCDRLEEWREAHPKSAATEAEAIRVLR